MEKDEQLAKFRHPELPVPASGFSNHAVDAPAKHSEAIVTVPLPAHWDPESLSKQVLNPVPQQDAAPRVPAAPAARRSTTDTVLVPKAAPRGWGKVEPANKVLDDTLPSLADSMAAGKGKRIGHH